MSCSTLAIISNNNINVPPRLSHSCDIPSRPKERLSTPKRRRVTFDESALLLEEKHETKPSTLKMSRFTETLDLLKSASAWDKFSLHRFGVEFDRTKHTELTTLITNPRYYDHETETTKIGFSDRYCRVIQGSQDVTEEELERYHSDQLVQYKISTNTLQDLLINLANMSLTSSRESEARDSEKGKQAPIIVHTPQMGKIPEETSSSSEAKTPPYTQLRFPISYETPQNKKRKFSDTSFGTHSTESTPQKLIQAETKVQALQDKFVTILLNRLWDGHVGIPWAKGRHMFLKYAETVKTSFQYQFCSSANPEQSVIGRVKAISDGTLELVTSKEHDSTKYCTWSKQRSTLSFEAKKVNIEWVNLLQQSGTEATQAVAETRAAQILAEMLGIVCHPEYYKSEQDQTSIIVHFDGFHVSVYFATFPASYLRQIRDVDLTLFSSPSYQHRVTLHHTERYNLFNTADRTEFIKEFVALVRYIAAGEANIGFLGKEREEIHRPERDMEAREIEKEKARDLVRPPQEDLDEREEREWIEDFASNYAN